MIVKSISVRAPVFPGLEERGRENSFINSDYSVSTTRLRFSWKLVCPPHHTPDPSPARSAERQAELGHCQDRVSPEAS